MGKLTEAARRKKDRTQPAAARQIIEGDAWRNADPHAPPRKEDGRYVHAMQLRLNDWEAGALAYCARQDGRSKQAMIRKILRAGLLACMESE